MLTRVFLHAEFISAMKTVQFYGFYENAKIILFLAEFISAMKTVQNPTVFMKTQK